MDSRMANRSAPGHTCVAAADGEIRPRQEFGAERGAETRPGQRVDEAVRDTGTDVTISV